MLALSVADVRDYIFIIFFGAGTLLVFFSLFIAYMVFRKIGSIMDAARGNLEATRTTLGNVAATSSLITDAVIKPIIKTSSVISGVRQGVMFAVKLARRGGGG